MKADIIYEKDVSNNLSEYLRENINKIESKLSNVNIFEIEKDSVEDCNACFTCWYGTPGICAKKDITKDINKAFVKDDLVVLFTPIKYGTFCSTIKKVIDRSALILLPYLKVTEGENHHVRRYKSSAKQIIVGYSENISGTEEKMFDQLIKANSLNFDIPKADVYICSTKEELKNTINKIIEIIKKED